MSSKFVLVVDNTWDAATIAGFLAPGVSGSAITTGSGATQAIDNLGKFLSDRAAEGPGISVAYWDAAVSATGTYTVASGNLSNNDTVTIGGVVFTAKTSGATGNQFNIGSTALATAQNCAAAVNASSNTYGIVTASAAAGASSSGVVTFTATVGGNVGNLITLTESGANGSVSGAALTGGSQAHTTTWSAGL